MSCVNSMPSKVGPLLKQSKILTLNYIKYTSKYYSTLEKLMDVLSSTIRQ